MKAIFKFNGNKVGVEVPTHLIHINKLTNAIAELDIDDYFDEEFNDAYDYLTLELADIFGKEVGIDGSELSVSFLNPETEEEREFGSIVRIKQD